MSRLIPATAFALIASLSVGCATKTQTGLLVGGAGGAAVGGAVGSASGNAGKGALIGGAIGLIGGGLIGHAADESDKADRERQAREQAERRDYTPRSQTTGSRAAPSPAYASTDDNAYGSYAAANRNASRVTREQVIQWTQAGVRDEIIVDRIERSDAVFRLTNSDEKELRQQGVSEMVIVAMRDTARR